MRRKLSRVNNEHVLACSLFAPVVEMRQWRSKSNQLKGPRATCWTWVLAFVKAIKAASRYTHSLLRAAVIMGKDCRAYPLITLLANAYGVTLVGGTGILTQPQQKIVCWKQQAEGDA